jgi:cytidylate kinase
MAIITISRAAFSGIEVLAEVLASDLGYRRYSREELLADAAKEYGALQSELESALIHKPGLLEGRGRKKLRFVQCARAAMVKAVRGDDIVYHGEAGHLLLGPIAHHLRVRAVAPMETRIANAVAQCNMVYEKAALYVAELDQKRAHWIRWIHGVDMDDPASFDLMVSLARMPLPSAVRLIADTARRDFQTTVDSQEALDALVIETELRARMGLASGISDDRMEVEVQRGAVTIRTTARFMAEAERAGDVAREIVGVVDVRSELKD